MSSPLSSAQAARQHVAERLDGIRQDAELSGIELSAASGLSKYKVSRILNAKTPPSPQDIRDICVACNAEDQAEDLIAASRRAESMYVDFRRMHRTGMTEAQVEIAPLIDETRHFRVYVSNVVPGFFQTFEYTAAILRMFATFQGTPDDSEQAAAARISRSQAIYRPKNTVAVLIEEHVLRHRFASDEVMLDQLDYLLEVMSLPNVSLGVVPTSARRDLWGLEAFYIFDDRRVNVETLTAAINIIAKPEIRDYTRAFVQMSKIAVYGGAARSLIQAAKEGLG